MSVIVLTEEIEFITLALPFPPVVASNRKKMWIKFLYENNLNLINISVASDRNLFYILFYSILKIMNKKKRRDERITNTQLVTTSAHADQPF